jgi:hypothetical protein
VLSGGSVNLIDGAAMTKPRKDQDEKPINKRVELEPDAWARFERFVQDIAKAGPQHRVLKPKPHKPRAESKVGKRKLAKKPSTKDGKRS